MNSETHSTSSGQARICQNCRNEFTVEPEDFQFYEKIKVPPPTWCPECRLRRRTMFRNERNLHRRKCGSCRKDIITIYAPESSLAVYCSECWYGDAWDPLAFQQNYDFSRPFFSQLLALWQKVPQLAINAIQNTNSPYTNFSGHNKDCYLVVNALYNENCAYDTRVMNCKDCLDSYDISKSTLCYEGLTADTCYASSFLTNSEAVTNSLACFDCKGSSDSLCCVNLRNQKLHVYNQPVSKDKFEEEKERLFGGSYEKTARALREFKDFTLRFPRRFVWITKSLNSTGDHIHASKNIRNSFFVRDSENLNYTALIGKVKDAMDIYADDESELGYEIMSGQTSSRYHFDIQCWYSQHVQYSVMAQNSSHLFACVGLRNKQYCILNKQYTKEEYEELVPRIIEHMNTMPYIDKQGRVYKYGEFFPPELSPFAYNETIAQEYFPLTREEAEKRGYRWRDPAERSYTITKTLDQLPDHIKDVEDSILQDTIQCLHNQTCNEQCTQAFKIIPQELQFYRKMNLPLPRLCPNCRHYQRLKQRNPLKLWHRTCACAGEKSENAVYTNTAQHSHGANHCPDEFETSYPPERPEIVYCEQCYNAEVV